MKKMLFLGLALFATAGAMVFAQTDPAVGFWLSVDDTTGNPTAGWQTYIEGGKLYGKILSSPGVGPSDKAVRMNKSYAGFPQKGDVNQKTILNTPWLFNLNPKKAGEWSGGNIIDPNDGKMYGGSVTFRVAGSNIPKGEEKKVGTSNNNGGKFRMDTLEMRGSILMFGRSQYWRKATEQQAKAVR